MTDAIESDVTLTRDHTKVDCYLVDGDMDVLAQSISATTFLVLAEAHAEVGSARLLELLTEIKNGRHTTADDLLAKLVAKNADERRALLADRPTRLLRQAADLCGVDAVGMSKGSAIRAIIENF